MAAKTYLVRRKINDEYNRDDIPDPAAHYVAAFADQAAAEAHLREVDWTYKVTQYHVGMNPLKWAYVPRPSSLPEFALRDWLIEAGLPVPERPLPVLPKQKGESVRDHQKRCDDAETTVWSAWWGRVVCKGRLTAAQREKVWEAFDGITFHEIEEVAEPADADPRADPEIVYAIVLKSWEYGDDWYYGDNRVRTVYRTREAAEAERDRLAADTRWQDEWNGGPHEYIVVELLHEPHTGG